MDLTEESFRALARSSPWRWTTLHLRRRRPEVEAWVRRPDDLLVHVPGRRPHRERTSSAGMGLVTLATSYRDDAVPGVAPPAPGPVATAPRQSSATPTYRPDGLVASRPARWELEHEDLMYENYEWVAMLDPIELADGTVLSDLRADERAGRATWYARVVAVDGYDPICSCCPLIWSAVSEALEHGDGWTPDDAAAYPAAYDVALDVRTGVVVECLPVGGRPPGDPLEVDLLGVDEDLDAVLAD